MFFFLKVFGACCLLPPQRSAVGGWDFSHFFKVIRLVDAETITFALSGVDVAVDVVQPVSMPPGASIKKTEELFSMLRIFAFRGRCVFISFAEKQFWAYLA